MKTRNNTTGRKNNQLSGVLLRAAAVLVSVVLLSFTVSAQDLWKELLSYNSFGKMALILVDESNATEANELSAATSTAAFSISEETDSPLNVESWMTNDEYFGSADVFNQVAQDETLKIENWMTDGDYFTSRYAKESDEVLPVEAWMCDASFFNN